MSIVEFLALSILYFCFGAGVYLLIGKSLESKLSPNVGLILSLIFIGLVLYFLPDGYLSPLSL